MRAICAAAWRDRGPGPTSGAEADAGARRFCRHAGQGLDAVDGTAERQTVVVPRTDVGIDQAPGTGLAEIRGGTTLSEVVGALNALGVAPLDMIDILKSIRAAGALHAEFVVY